MWTVHIDSGNYSLGGQTSKNIYLGETRIVTKLNQVQHPTLGEESAKTYYYRVLHFLSENTKV